MKPRTIIQLCLLIAVGYTPSAASAQGTDAAGYYDITDYYLKNAGFDTDFDYDRQATGDTSNDVKEVAEWTATHTAKSMAVVATFQWGSPKTFYEKAVPTTASDGTTDGGGLVICSALKKALTYVQTMTLPTGRYKLVTAYYNCNNESQEGNSMLGWIPADGSSSVVSMLDNFPYGQWITDTVSFTISESQKGSIQIGIRSIMGLMGESAMVAIDYVRLLRDTPYSDEYDSWGATPTVTTNRRYARGATMAFGRMTASIADGQITERGFCYSEQPNPTVADQVTSATLENNGTIYWLRDLKPATLYYMRAYAKSEGRRVGYGDVIKFYTLPKGKVTFSMRTSGDAASDRIKAAAQTAIDWWNNLTEMNGFSTSIGYNSGGPTAECSYGGWMSVGSNTSYQRPGTIMHEMLHGCGVIPWADTEWSRHNLRASVNGDGYGTGQWLGDRVTEVLRFWDNNSTASLNGDYQHMWPYGINGASEDNGSDVLYIGNGLVCQALGEDGLQHTYSCFAEPYYAFNHEDTIKYYLKNEDPERGLYTSLLTVNASGALRWTAMTAAEAAANDSAAWYLTFTPSNQYYQLRNAATGRYLTCGGTFTTAQRTSPNANDNFHLMRGRVDVGEGTSAMRGYWIIHPTSDWTPPCLQAAPGGAVTRSTFNIANSSTTQRWLIMSGDEMEAYEHAAVERLRSAVGSTLDLVSALALVPHTEETAGTDDLFDTTLADIRQRAAEATTAAQLISLESEADAAAYAFLCNATPTDVTRPFDLSYMIADRGLDAVDGWSGTPSLSYSCAEYYQTAFDFHQTVDRLPAGTYQMCMQGFQRPGSADDAYNQWASGSNNVNAEIYAGAASRKVAHIATGAQTASVGGSERTVGGRLYIPNNMHAASLYFARGLYDNAVATTVADDGDALTIGIRSSSQPSSYWTIFDNFRLYFYGSRPVDELQGVGVATVSTAVAETVYDLQGRRVERPQRGIYIVGGRKVVR